MKSNKVLEAKNKILSVNACKKNELYDSMIYWSQKAYNICDILIDTFSKKGDIIFDPFLGSGVTLFEAIKNNTKRNAIGCEINDPPIFIIKTILKDRNSRLTNKRLDQFAEELTNLNSYYEVSCPNCGKTAIVRSTIFDFIDNNDISLKSSKIICSCKTKHVEPCPREYKDKINISLNLKNIEDIELIPNSRIAVKAGQHISSIFTRRNLMVLDSILELRKNYEDIKDLIDYILLSMLHLCKITDTHSNSQWPLWIPSVNCVEKNILIIFNKKINQFKKTISFASKEYKNAKEVSNFSFAQNNYRIIQKGIQNITNKDIPDNSIDLVITDPPYLGQVAYSEYMQLYKPFLNFNINYEDEIVVSSAPSRNKTTEEYFYLLEKAFNVISKKTKENSYLCLYFHDASLKVWDRLITILSNCSFYYVSQVHIKKSNTVKNNLSPKKSMNGDAILFFAKDPEALQKIKNTAIQTEDISLIEHSIIKEAKFMLKEKKEISTTELYDGGIMEMLIQNNWITTISKHYTSLVEVFEKYLVWDNSSNTWRLKE